MGCWTRKERIIMRLDKTLLKQITEDTDVLPGNVETPRCLNKLIRKLT